MYAKLTFAYTHIHILKQFSQITALITTTQLPLLTSGHLTTEVSQYQLQPKRLDLFLLPQSAHSSAQGTTTELLPSYPAIRTCQLKHNKEKKNREISTCQKRL